MNFFDDTIIVSLSKNMWNSPYWMSRHFLMYELAQHVSVLYVADRIYIHDLFKISTLKNLKIKAPYNTPQKLKNCTLNNYIPQFSNYPKLDKFCFKLFGKLIRKSCRRLGKKKIIAYVWHPDMIECLDSLKPDYIIYHPYDRFVLFSNSSNVSKQDQLTEKIEINEKRLLDIADAVITPHKKIANELNSHNINIIRNGTFLVGSQKYHDDFIDSMFGSFLSPIIGYVGVINSKIDFKIIFHLAANRPGWTFVFLGPVTGSEWQEEQAYKDVIGLKNVHFLGPVSADKVYACMMNLDVGIMPYDISTWAGYCESPLKLYQYWACRVPVVSVPLPQINNIPGIISIASSLDEWCVAIEWELSHNSESIKKQRYEKARENSWSNKAKEVLAVIKAL
jgi:hypothetical protein